MQPPAAIKPSAENALDLAVHSANGTYVNQQRLTKNQPVAVSDKDFISFVTTSKDCTKGKHFAACCLYACALGPSCSELPLFQLDVPVQDTHAASSAGFDTQIVPSQTTVPERLRSPAARKRNFLKRYEQLHELGSGSFATVYAVRKRGTQQIMAAKQLNKRRLAMHTGNVQDLIQEAHMHHQVQHPCFLRLHDVLENEQFLYLIMDLAEGGELFDRLVNGTPYSEPRAQRLVWRLAAAVSHMHERGIVHRDLKPENVLLMSKTDDTSAVIADFGVAKQVGSGLQTFVGTPQYLAPEVQAAGGDAPGKYGTPADMWSLGVIIYIIMCGFPPFDQHQYKRQGAAVTWSFQHDPWPAASAEVKQVITQLLQPQPEQRMTVDELLAHPWLASQATQPEQLALLSAAARSTLEAAQAGGRQGGSKQAAAAAGAISGAGAPAAAVQLMRQSSGATTASTASDVEAGSLAVPSGAAGTGVPDDPLECSDITGRASQGAASDSSASGTKGLKRARSMPHAPPPNETEGGPNAAPTPQTKRACTS